LAVTCSDPIVHLLCRRIIVVTIQVNILIRGRLVGVAFFLSSFSCGGFHRL
jgi:hypothetical protein